MSYSKPDYLKQGEPARLFPVLSVTSKEGRTTSIFLACLARVDEFCATLLGPLERKSVSDPRFNHSQRLCFRMHPVVLTAQMG